EPVAALAHEDPTTVQRPASLGDVHAGDSLDMAQAAPAHLGRQIADGPQDAQVPGRHGNMLFIGKKEQIADKEPGRVLNQGGDRFFRHAVGHVEKHAAVGRRSRFHDRPPWAALRAALSSATTWRMVFMRNNCKTWSTMGGTEWMTNLPPALRKRLCRPMSQ